MTLDPGRQSGFPSEDGRGRLPFAWKSSCLAKTDAARGGPVHADGGIGNGALARARFADQTKGFAFVASGKRRHPLL